MTHSFSLRFCILAGVAALTGLGGCTGNLDHPTTLSHTRVEVHHEPYNMEVSNHLMDESAVAALADDYRRFGGEEPLLITVVFDPSSRTNTASNAVQESKRIATLLRQNGVDNFKTEIMPEGGVGETAKTRVAYVSYSAKPPRGCSDMPGLDNTVTDWKYGKSYGLGCAIEKRIARQISRPADLLGRGKHYETSSGRRAANIVEGHQAGAPNEPLEGTQTTE